MDPLLNSLQNVFVALGGLLFALVGAFAPWIPLLAWIAFWLFAVNWRQLYPVLAKGGWIGVVLIALLTILVWSEIVGPENPGRVLFGLHVHSIVEKSVFVTGLMVIAMLCGTVQVTGCCSALCQFDEPAPAEESHHGH